GTFQSAGIVSIRTNLFVGQPDGCLDGAVGVATLNGGILFVTNAAHDATLDVRNGTFTLNPGAILIVDKLVLTNACGHFINNGGILNCSNITMDQNLDTDGDGHSNHDETLAGTDPFNPASAFRLSGVTLTNGNVRLDWTTVGGHSYVVQTTSSLDNQFHDI